MIDQSIEQNQNIELRKFLHSLSNDMFVIQGTIYLLLKNDSLVSDKKNMANVERMLCKSNKILRDVKEFRENIDQK